MKRKSKENCFMLMYFLAAIHAGTRGAKPCVGIKHREDSYQVLPIRVQKCRQQAWTDCVVYIGSCWMVENCLLLWISACRQAMYFSHVKFMSIASQFKNIWCNPCAITFVRSILFQVLRHVHFRLHCVLDRFVSQIHLTMVTLQSLQA